MTREDPTARIAETGESVLLLRQGLVNVIGWLAIAAIGVILVPIMLGGLGSERYGLWIAALALSEMLSAIDFGLGWSVTREVARGASADSARFASSAANALLALGTTGMVVIAAFGQWIAGAFGLGAEAAAVAPGVFVAIGIGFAGESLSGYVTAVLYGVRRFDLVTLFHVGLALLRATGFVVLLAADLSLIALGVWYAFSTWVAAIIGAMAIRRLYSDFSMRLRWIDTETLRRHVSFSLASQFAALGTTAVWRAPALLLGFMRGAAAIVPYHVGQRPPLLAYSIGWRMAEATFPAASQHHGADDQEIEREVLHVGTRGSLVMLLPLLIVVAGAAPWILELWLGSADPAAVSVLRITAAAVLAHMLGAAALHVLWGQGKARVIVWIVASMTAAIVVLAWLLIPRFGPAGAAWAAVLPMLAGSLKLLDLASSACGSNLRTVTRSAVNGLILPSVLAMVAVLALTYWLRDGGWPGIIFTSFITGLVFLAALYVFGGEERRLMKQAAGRLRTMLRKVKVLRIVRDFTANSSLLDNRYTTREYWEGVFSEERDPWHYETIAEHGTDRFEGALAMLKIAAGPAGSLGHVLEIGCAEGHFTEFLEPRCDRLLAVDISAVALERARTRRKWRSTVRFEQWDALHDPLPGGTFDVVVAMGVLDYVMRLHELRQLRERLASLVRPGGYLLVESTRTGGDLEDTWWRRVLPRGRWLNPFVAEHRVLEKVEECLTPICARTIYKKLS